jgi:hypothetical protein
MGLLFDTKSPYERHVKQILDSNSCDCFIKLVKWDKMNGLSAVAAAAAAADARYRPK